MQGATLQRTGDAVSNVPDLAELTLEHFRPLVDQAFDLRAPDVELELRLDEAVASGHAGPGTRQPFSLIFTAASSAVLPQGIYHVEHSTIGAMDVFLVPVGLRHSRVEYQAVFN
jgi:hypothetical protein